MKLMDAIWYLQKTGSSVVSAEAFRKSKQGTLYKIRLQKEGPVIFGTAEVVTKLAKYRKERNDRVAKANRNPMYHIN